MNDHAHDNCHFPLIDRYEGNRNASGAIALDKNHFIVADDESNDLAIYHKFISSNPLQIVSLPALFPGQIDQNPEMDLEGAAELDGRYFWIGSHSTNAEGKTRVERKRLFALRIEWDVTGDFAVCAEGDIYGKLLDDLAKDPRYADYGLKKAQKLPPKALGGLSIEGLAATRDQGLLIGFRNPLIGGKIENNRLVGGKALIVHLLNPVEVINGLPARFGDPIELDLGGLGIRDIVLRKKRKYLIVAGPYDNSPETGDCADGQHRLYSWSMKSGKLKLKKKIDLGSLNIEAAFFYPNDDTTVQLLIDDGKLEGGKGFRSVRIKI